MVLKLEDDITNSAPITAIILAIISGGTRPQRSAIQPPIGLNNMATHDENEVSNATSVALRFKLRVIGFNPALRAEFEKASRNRPPNANHQITPALPLIFPRESMQLITSSTPRIFIGFENEHADMASVWDAWDRFGCL